MKIRITADSTCDMPLALLEQHGVTLMPLTVVLGEEMRYDGVDITQQEIFDAVENGRVVKTAARNAYEYGKLFQRVLDDCDAVIHLSLSKKLSASYASACLAAQDFDNVYVVDSRNLSVGSTMLILFAVHMADKGMEPALIAAKLGNIARRVDTSFILEQVDYLFRGGRCSGVEAVGAKMLHIRPSIEVTDGEMGVGRKYRGRFERCLEKYVADKLEDKDSIDFTRAFVVQAGCPDEWTRQVHQQLIDAGFAEVIDATAGCTISTHCGPHTLGIIFLRKDAKV